MPPKLESVIFCDDIRQEAANKSTLVRIYGKYLLMPATTEFPSALRQLCLFIRWTDVVGGEKLLLSCDFGAETIFKAPTPSVMNVPAKVDDYSQTSIYLVPFLLKG